MVKKSILSLLFLALLGTSFQASAIDNKRSRFMTPKRAAKVSFGLVVTGALGYLGYSAYSKIKDYRMVRSLDSMFNDIDSGRFIVFSNWRKENDFSDGRCWFTGNDILTDKNQFKATLKTDVNGNRPQIAEFTQGQLGVQGFINLQDRIRWELGVMSSYLFDLSKCSGIFSKLTESFPVRNGLEEIGRAMSRLDNTTLHGMKDEIYEQQQEKVSWISWFQRKLSIDLMYKSNRRNELHWKLLNMYSRLLVISDCVSEIIAELYQQQQVQGNVRPSAPLMNMQ